MKKLLLLTFILVLLLPLVNAHFTQDHTADILIGFNEINSPITALCKDHIDKVIDGNFAADITVIHYLETAQGNQLSSYVFTHSRGSGYENCMDKAGSDVEKKCFCYGVGLHITQDVFSHGAPGVEGYTEKYLYKSLQTNLIGHMIIEKDFQNKQLKVLREKYGDGFIDELMFYAGENKASTLCDNLCDETGCKGKFMDLLNLMAGTSMEKDASTICKGYKGYGFYDTVYKDKLSLPLWAYAVSLGLAIVALLLIILTLIFANKGLWKYLLIIYLLMFLIVGVGVYATVLTGTTWKVTNIAISVPSAIGLISMSEADVEYFENIEQKATNAFLTTGILKYDDASGLSYYDRNGKFVNGTLNKASIAGNIIYYFVLPGILLLLFVFLSWKAFRKK